MSRDFLELAEMRYSVRKFSDRAVEQEAIEKILRAGQLAPTACNKQPQKVYILRSEKALQKLRLCTYSHFDAPLALLVCFDRERSWKRDFDGRDSGWVDSSIVATHMMLEACELGIGSTWVMHFIPEAVQTEFELPPQEVPVALLVMGYPSKDASPSPLHDQTKAIDEFACYL